MNDFLSLQKVNQKFQSSRVLLNSLALNDSVKQLESNIKNLDHFLPTCQANSNQTCLNYLRQSALLNCLCINWALDYELFSVTGDILHSLLFILPIRSNDAQCNFSTENLLNSWVNVPCFSKQITFYNVLKINSLAKWVLFVFLNHFHLLCIHVLNFSLSFLSCDCSVIIDIGKFSLFSGSLWRFRIFFVHFPDAVHFL